MMVARVEAIYEARAQGDFLAEAPKMIACFAELEEPLSRDVAPHYLRARAYSWFPSRDFAKVEAALRALHDLEPDAHVPSKIAPVPEHPMAVAQAHAIDTTTPRPEPVSLPPIPGMSYRVNGVSTAVIRPDVLNVVQIVSPAIGVFYNRELYPGETFSLKDVPGLDLAQRQVAHQIQRSNRLMMSGGALVLAGGALGLTTILLDRHADMGGVQPDSWDDARSMVVRREALLLTSGTITTFGLGLGVAGVTVRW